MSIFNHFNALEKNAVLRYRRLVSLLPRMVPIPNSKYKL